MLAGLDQGEVAELQAGQEVLPDVPYRVSHPALLVSLPDAAGADGKAEVVGEVSLSPIEDRDLARACRNTVPATIRRHAKWAGIKLEGRLTIHGIRKSCGQGWANHLPLNVVKGLMGHADLAITAEFHSRVGRDHEAHARWATEAITVVQTRTSTDARVTPGAQNTAKRKAG